MIPRIRGRIGSKISEGNNKNFSSKRRMLNLKMSKRMTRSTPKTAKAIHCQGEVRHSVIRVK